ncbi:hypothetical protein RND81_03G040000 [Saponaria officinalis]|uniref:TTF-type domain-containing protein n=1 Tax=Saponaria officinalis TaxID=3572 RepID=A0AAW1M596_SAPOF
MGPIQPKNHEFPFKLIGGKSRRFKAEWFDKHENWLEYSKKKDALFCLPCYLFKSECVRGGDAFVEEGFSYWNKKQRLNEHVGGVNSAHNLAVERYENLKDEKNSIQTAFHGFSEQDKKDYKTRLEASIIFSRYLLRMGLPFHGHDESDESNNQGNFIELLKVVCYISKDFEKVMLKSGPGNLQLIAPSIQKEIVNCVAKETLKLIFEELGDDLFGILVDESSDVSYKEQMGIVLCYVNKQGIVVERFVGIVHVTNTSALSLKSAIDSLFDEFKLSMSSIRGQGYDGASNMRGEFGGLKTLIQKNNSFAYYTYCFARQLQLTLVATAKGHVYVVWFFYLVSDVVNVIGSSYKRRDLEEMASFYPYDFDDVLVRVLSGELKNYIVDVRSHIAFVGLKGLGDLARVMVKTKKNVIYPHVYLLLKLALILPVATASVERAFSAMKYIKTKLRNRMCDDFLNNCLLTYVERDICESVSIDDIMYRFQNMKSRRGCLV